MFAKALYWSQNRILSALHLKLFSNNYTIIIFFFFFCLPDNDTNINSKKDISKFILSSFSFVSFMDIFTSI